MCVLGKLLKISYLFVCDDIVLSYVCCMELLLPEDVDDSTSN